MKRIDRAQLYTGLVISGILIGWQFILILAGWALFEKSVLAGIVYSVVIGACMVVILWPITAICLRATFGIVRGQ